MTLPTLDKTWIFDVNNLLAAGVKDTNSSNAFYGIKSAMTSSSSSSWVVVSSSNAVTADGNDNWSSAADLTWDNAGSAHSWIIFKQNAISSDLQILWDLVGTNSHRMDVVVSRESGFVSGTTLNRPTATDESVLLNGSTQTWGGSAISAGTIYHWHFLMSDDGECTRVFFTYDDEVAGFWAFDKIKNAPSELTIPMYIIFSSDAVNAAFPDKSANYVFLRRMGSSIPFYFFPHSGSLEVDKCSFASEGFNNAGIGEADAVSPDRINIANEISNEWEMMPLTVWSDNGATFGKLGEVFDLWFSPDDLTASESPAASGSCVTGATLNPSGSYDFCIMDNVMIPWDGLSVPIVSGSYSGGKPPISGTVPVSSNHISFTTQIGGKDGSVVVIATDEIEQQVSIAQSGTYDRHRLHIKYPYGRRRPRIGDFSEG